MDRNETIRIGVGVVVFRGEEVLVVKRGKEPLKGKWSIPGGGLEFGEALEAGVLREVREETGLDVRLTGSIGVFEALPGDHGQTGHTILIDYIAEWIGGEPVADDDAEEAEFVSIDEAMARLSWDETRRALAMALAQRAAGGS